MAKGKVTVICCKCGAEFTKKMMFNTRKEADQWEFKATSTYNLCPKCWKLEENKMGAEEGVYYKILLYTNGILKKQPKKNILFEFEKNSYPLRYKLRELGATFVNDRWTLCCSFDEVDEYIEKFEPITAKITSVPFKKEVILYKELMEKKASLFDMSESNYPEVTQEQLNHSWNGKFYGRTDNWCIYINGEKTSISNATRNAILGENEISEEEKKFNKEAVKTILDLTWGLNWEIDSDDYRKYNETVK